MNVLGIDYGLKNIGVAIGDSRIKIASPYSIIQNKGVENFCNSLNKIIQNEQIEKIIVGVPYGLSNNYTEQTKKVLGVIQKMKKLLNIEIILEDERFTTKQADYILSENKKRNQPTDDVVAMIILQSYFDKVL